MTKNKEEVSNKKISILATEQDAQHESGTNVKQSATQKQTASKTKKAVSTNEAKAKPKKQTKQGAKQAGAKSSTKTSTKANKPKQQNAKSSSKAEKNNQKQNASKSGTANKTTQNQTKSKQKKQSENELNKKQQAKPVQEQAIQNEPELVQEQPKQAKQEQNKSTQNQTQPNSKTTDKPKENLGLIQANTNTYVQMQDGQTTQTKTKVGKIVGTVILILLALVLVAFTIFTFVSMNNSTISYGVSIFGVDVSGLDKTAATDKISGLVRQSLDSNIVLKHGDFEANISPEQLETSYDVDGAIKEAFDIGSGSNALSNSMKKISLLIHPTNITPKLSINNDDLQPILEDISTQLPDAVIQSDYYIDGNNLIITKGKAGVIIDVASMEKTIPEKLQDLSFANNPIEIATIDQTPTAPDIDQIYKEIHKDAQDAHYDAATHVVYPEETGLDFTMSLDEAKEKLAAADGECDIPLKVVYPNVTTNMIGMEAFPDLLSTFSTRYQTSNADRTTNLKLAAGKVNGTVVLPGQTFSYNSTVGERTIAAGYKEAKIYQDGQVIDGLGGGICQISTTLYNAALYANLEIVERRNHQFVPSYVGAGRDATVVYGSQDFKFKNNRNYAIKIVCSVDKGVATFNIYGLHEDGDYEVEISSNIISRTANSLTSATYKTLKQNGNVVSTSTVSKDTYKVH